MILEVTYIKFRREIKQFLYVRDNITFLEIFEHIRGNQKELLLDIRDIYLKGTNERIFYNKN